MNFIDLATQQARIREALEKRILAVLDHGKYVMGPEIGELETALAEYVGVKHCISCSSGTDALLLALMAYDVKPGDAIICPSFTFVATAEVVSLLGATPIFIDIDPDTYNLDPSKLEAAAQKAKDDGLNLKGIIPVDLFGLPADYPAIETFAKERGLFVLEDACQGFGGELNGKKLCSFGDVAATSFFPAKPLGCYGDGGAVFTNDDKLADEMRSVRIHGMGSDKYDNVRIGINGRMDTIQATVLLEKLTIFPEEVELRQTVASAYTEGLKDVVKTPVIPTGMTSAWAQYSLQAEDKEGTLAALQKAGIPAATYYPIPLHLQTAYKYLNYSKGDLPVSEAVSQKIFSLPMHPYLTTKEIEKIVTSIKGV